MSGRDLPRELYHDAGRFRPIRRAHIATSTRWPAVLTVRMLGSVSGRNQPRAVMNAALVAVVAWLVTTLLYVNPALWYAPAAEAETDYPEYAERAESLLFEQPLRIDAAMTDIAPGAVGAPAGFFMGFAGYAEERVFAEEIKLAASVMAERYGTGDRSLLLLNDRRDLDSAPLATVSSLRYALAAMARKMDRDEDVLFLSLSSHGSEADLAVSHGPLTLEDLSDEALAQALDDAGIKWRVIIISACYSGGFIDALRNPDTIVITAAAADRTSFGCNDERELTYFGEAFYRDALPEAGSLRDAFETTVESIAERERREDIEPSHPQAHFGEAIEEKLGELEPSH